jgi:hypothetical protein
MGNLVILLILGLLILFAVLVLLVETKPRRGRRDE